MTTATAVSSSPNTGQIRFHVVFLFCFNVERSHFERMKRIIWETVRLEWVFESWFKLFRFRFALVHSLRVCTSQVPWLPFTVQKHVYQWWALCFRPGWQFKWPSHDNKCHFPGSDRPASRGAGQLISQCSLFPENHPLKNIFVIIFDILFNHFWNKGSLI